ncbi:daptide biosynthesis RiPP recognition protein [Micrococcaceae bacterium Sec5.1]
MAATPAHSFFSRTKELLGVGELTLSQQQTIAAAVDQWITGMPGRIAGHVIFVENPEHIDYAKTLVTEGSVILALNGDKDDEAITTVSGSFDAAGEELLVDGTLSLEIQDYVAIPFVNLVGVTVVRITTSEDWQAFFDDAEEARRSGHFVRQLTEVNAVLSERALLARVEQQSVSLARFHITSDGRILSGPYGAEIGWVGEAIEDLHAKSVGPGTAMANCQVDVEALKANPWIPRYLAALDAWKFIPREARETTRFVGFGVSLFSTASGFPSAFAPFLVQRAGEYTLLDTQSGRVFKIGVDAATIIEAISNFRDVRSAAAVIAPALNVSETVATGSVTAVLNQFEQFGIDLIGTNR